MRRLLFWACFFKEAKVLGEDVYCDSIGCAIPKVVNGIHIEHLPIHWASMGKWYNGGYGISTRSDESDERSKGKGGSRPRQRSKEDNSLCHLIFASDENLLWGETSHAPLFAQVNAVPSIRIPFSRVESIQFNEMEQRDQENNCVSHFPRQDAEKNHIFSPLGRKLLGKPSNMKRKNVLKKDPLKPRRTSSCRWFFAPRRILRSPEEESDIAR